MSQYQLTTNPVRTGSFTVAAILLLIILGMWGCPRYSVYNSKLQGQAKLAHAQSAKEVAVAEAKAKMESAALLASADTIRAHGIARSNEIIGQSLKNNESYLRWLWIDQLEKIQGQIVYIPTESNMPILEASRLQQRSGRQDTTK